MTVEDPGAWADENLKVQATEGGGVSMQIGDFFRYKETVLTAEQAESLLEWLESREGRLQNLIESSEVFYPLTPGDPDRETGYLISGAGNEWRWIWMEPGETDDMGEICESRAEAHRSAIKDWDDHGTGGDMSARMRKGMKEPKK